VPLATLRMPIFTDASSGPAKVTESTLPFKGNENLKRTFLLCTSIRTF
jgi:hypothetical protein